MNQLKRREIWLKPESIYKTKSSIKLFALIVKEFSIAIRIQKKLRDQDVIFMYNPGPQFGSQRPEPLWLAPSHPKSMCFLLSQQQPGCTEAEPPSAKKTE